MITRKTALVLLPILYIISTLALIYGLGYYYDFDHTVVSTGLLFLGCYILSSANKFTLISLLVTFSVLSFYFPTGINYGKPTADLLMPLLQTNKLEIIGYLMAVKQQILITVVFIFIQGLIYYLNKIIKTQKIKKNKISQFVSVMSFIFFYIITLLGISYQNLEVNNSAFLKNVISAYQEINSIHEEMKKYIGSNNNNIRVSRLNEDDNTEIFLVVIGESVRKDYLSVYGYPLNTTPFLNTANGIFIDGLVAAGPNTEQSLTRTLFKAYPEKNKIDWEINFVSLAKKSGYETYWVSNQGTSEYGDNIFSALAGTTDKSKFLKKGPYYTSFNDDDHMLPIVSEIINKNSNKKVVFVHMMGSHEPICSQINDFKSNFKLNNQAGCYVASIEKLDLFIKKLTELMKGKKYKLMYFSDHGLSVEPDRIFHDLGGLLQEYQVPLFYLALDEKKHILVKKVISGLNLIDLYSTFINIKTNVTNENYTFYYADKLPDNSNPIIYWKKYRRLSDLVKNQPPITDIEVNSASVNIKHQ